MAEPASETSCKDCNQIISGKHRAVQCGFCDNHYCFKCSKLKQTLFNEIGREAGVSFNCIHCRIAMPSMNKILAKLVSLEERLQKLENRDGGSEKCDRDMIRDVIREEKEEEQERENRKLNIIVHSLPESRKPTLEEKKEEDSSEVEKILNETLNLNVKFENVLRLGKFADDRTKSRPMRLSVSDFDTKRKILNASRHLKNHEKYSSVFLTPDLTASQRKAAFDLREEKRRRERAGERNLAIRKGRIVELREKSPSDDHSYVSAKGRKGQNTSSPRGGRGPFR